MADTKTPIISINTGEAVKNVQELKDNIKELKKQLDSVETSTEDYADIVSQLSQNQAALRNVMNGVNSTFDVSIKDAQGLTTSYNSLVQQLKQATQEWRTIPKYLTDADQAQGKVNQAWTEAANKVERLRSELKDMDADTNSYVRNVGNYKSALEGFSGTMGQIKQVGGDMVNGISAAASSMALLGINTDGLSQSMNNLRIVTAAVQGAKGFAGMLVQLRNYFKVGKQAAQVTKEQTVATQAQTTAQNAANAATTQGAVAMGVLQKALIATGIGALVVALGMLVANFEDVVKWVGKIGEKFGLWKVETDKITGATDKLKDKIEQQNHALDNEQKILKAQGASNTTLLKQKRELVQQQINDTKATIENVKARIAQLQADDRWWKFWQGTKGKIKKATEELEGLEEVLKNLNQINTDIGVDIRVEGINEANKAAEKAKKDAEEAIKLAQEVVKKGVDAVKKINQANETELQKINREHQENLDLINAAIKASATLTGVTQEQVDLLKNGLAAEATRYSKTLEDYWKKDYEKKVAAYDEKVTAELKAQYEEAVRTERIRANVLGLDKEQAEVTAKASAERRRDFEILKKQFEYIKKDIPFEIFENVDLKAMTPEEIRKEFGEPTATAILKYFETEEKLELAGEELAKEILTGYEEAIEKAIENGELNTADILWKNLSQTVREMFKDEDLAGIGGAAIQYVKSINDAIEEARKENPLPDNWILGDIFAGFDKNGKILLAGIRAQMQQLRDEGKEASDEFVMLSEQATKLSMKLWDDYFKKIGKHFSSYGKATANVMDAVADAWEAALQAQVKNGKKSEEQAKKSFNNVKALQISSAVINTAAAVVQALADPTVPSYYVKAANAVAAGIAGAAQIIKISSTDFSASAGNATDNTPKLVDRTPQLQYVVGVNEADYAQAQAANPIRAYVVDRDLSEGLDEYNKRKDETTF